MLTHHSLNNIIYSQNGLHTRSSGSWERHLSQQRKMVRPEDMDGQEHSPAVSLCSVPGLPCSFLSVSAHSQ